MVINDNLKTTLKNYGQEHVLKFWDQLSVEEKQSLEEDADSIDYAHLQCIYEQAMDQMKQEQDKKDELMEPLPNSVFCRMSEETKETITSWSDEGLRQVADGRVGVLLLAGGQGTRLGVDYPKGMYNVGMPSQKTLYQIQAERILKLQEIASSKYGENGVITWYIMTSEATKEKTEKFFDEHDHFGLQKENVVVFEQHRLPCLTFDGKIILENKSRVSKAPDGNGGLYKALKSAKIVEDMDKRGIQFVHVYCVDNILVKVADPIFIGYCLSKGATCAAKVVEKVEPTEAVGVICKLDGKYQVIEYSEICQTTAAKRSSDGHLLFNAGNICNHLFTTGFLKYVIKEHLNDLPHHVAKKKIPFVDDSGNRIKPDSANGIKMEKFVFDVFQFSNKFAVLEVERETDFSPLKNAPGAAKDSAETAKRDLANLHYSYILKAGGKFINSNGDLVPVKTTNAPVICEISPLLSYAGEGLEDIVGDKEFSVNEPIHLRNNQEIGRAKNEVNSHEPAKKKIKEC